MPKHRKPSGCAKVKSSALKRCFPEPPMKFECVTRTGTPEEIARMSANPYQVNASEVRQQPIKPSKTKPLILPKAPPTAKNSIELEFSAQLAQRINGKTEYANPAGRIDVLTDRFVIEVKIAENWKHAIGQVLVYSSYFPDHAPLICLIGNVKLYFEIAEKHCNKLNTLLRTKDNFF